MKVILYSIRTFWYKGLAKISEKIEFKNMCVYWNIIVGTEKLKKKKVLFCIWKLILGRNDIKWPIYDIISNIQYIKRHIKHRSFIITIISNFLLKYIVFLAKWSYALATGQMSAMAVAMGMAKPCNLPWPRPWLLGPCPSLWSVCLKNITKI